MRCCRMAHAVGQYAGECKPFGLYRREKGCYAFSSETRYARQSIFKSYGLSFRGKTHFFRLLRAERRCAAASRFTFSKGKTL